MNISHILYPACKYSGPPWLADVPGHWEVRRLRTVAEMRVSNVDKRIRESEFPVRLCNYVDVYKNDRITLVLPFMNATASREEIERFRLERGDVLITKDSEAWDDIGVPSLVVESAYDLLSGYHLALLRPFKEILGAYLAWVLQGRSVAYQFHVRARGVTRYGLTHVGIQSVRIPLPPLPEQRAIVHYLDYVDRRIRRYITAKQKLIDLLEEERQAIINQAVTRGLDPNVRLKPSGVEWLGDVPEHWEVMPVKRAFISMDYGISESASDSGAIRLLTMGHLKDGQVIVPNDGGVDFVAPHLLLQKGDLLFNRTNSQELVGKVGLFIGHDTPVTFASYLVRMRPHPSHEPEYLNIALNDASFISRARREAIPSLHQSNLNPTRFGRIHTALPSKEEQVAILRTLREETKSLGTAIAAARRQIELLQEYRTRLISDVVTGKLDVREAAAQLPDEGDDGQDPIEENGPTLDNMDEDSYNASQPTEEELAIESEVTA